MMKKSPLATVDVAPLMNGVSVSKFVVAVPESYLTILEIVAPACVFVKVDVNEPLEA